jgi:hypothetical protein
VSALRVTSDECDYDITTRVRELQLLGVPALAGIPADRAMASGLQFELHIIPN